MALSASGCSKKTKLSRIFATLGLYRALLYDKSYHSCIYSVNNITIVTSKQGRVCAATARAAIR